MDYTLEIFAKVQIFADIIGFFLISLLFLRLYSERIQLFRCYLYCKKVCLRLRMVADLSISNRLFKIYTFRHSNNLYFMSQIHCGVSPCLILGGRYIVQCCAPLLSGLVAIHLLAVDDMSLWGSASSHRILRRDQEYSLFLP